MTHEFDKISADWIRANINLFIKKRVVIITGAGISVSAGIPDFRSANGIFSEIRRSLRIKGEDLFNYRYSRDDATRPSYYKFVSQLKDVVDRVEPSATHEFLNDFKRYQKKYRVYTQNIDSLEERAGLNLQEKKGCGPELVYLHGDMKVLVCIFCGFKSTFTSVENDEFKKGNDIPCVKCVESNKKRKDNKVRQLKEGYLHTNIIHYNQPHYDGHRIANMFESDMDLDLFIVMGTSLKVYGVKDFVKRALRCCINNNGVSILVNLEEPTKEFRNLFDFFWMGTSDDFCMEVSKNIEEYIEIRKMKKPLAEDGDKIVSYTNKTLSYIENMNSSNMDKASIIKENKKIEKASKESISVEMNKKIVKKTNVSESVVVESHEIVVKKNGDLVYTREKCVQVEITKSEEKQSISVQESGTVNNSNLIEEKLIKVKLVNKKPKRKEKKLQNLQSFVNVKSEINSKK